MKNVPLEKETVVLRLNGIEEELSELQKIAKVPFKEFSGDPYKLSQYHLHRALEGVFHIASHILSRFPGGNKGGTYKEMAKLLGENGIVKKEFANQQLKQMAGYRNRLVHFYSEISLKEIYDLINNDLGDIEVFLRSIKSVLADPKKYGLE